MKAGQNSSSWTSERSLMFGANVQSTMAPPSSASTASIPAPSSSSMATSLDGVSFFEGDLLLQALNGFVLVVTAEGYVFYTSPTIQDFLGFHQSDVVHQSVFELIHTDDRALFRRQLHFSLNPPCDGASSPSEQNSAEISTNMITYDPQVIPPENSSFLERNFCCRFRCLLDNSSGFLALNFRGRLKFIHGQNRVSEDGKLVPPQLALFSIATPLQTPSILEIRTKTLIFQTKHKLDFTPMGIDTRGKVVLGYNEVELCMKGSGYHFIHAADMMYCAENHLRMMKTGDSGFTVFRLLTKNQTWVWVQASARLVFKGGKPDFIVARQRALTNEEGEEQLRLRRLQLPFNFATGEALLYDTAPSIDIPDPCSAPKQRKMDSYSVSRDSILGCMLSQDQSIYCEHNSANTLSSLNDMAFKDTHATVNVPGDAASKSAVGGLVKPEATVQDMVETLQEILGDGDLSETLEVGPDELKSWESTLLKMNFNSCEFSDNLNDILSNDILSYVEEQLRKEGGLQLPDQLDDVPTYLSSLELQTVEADQDFGWPLEPPNQLISNGGMMELSHLDFPGLQQSFPAPLQLGAPVTFNSSLSNVCPQTQNPLITLQVNATDNNLAAFPLRPANPLLPNQMTQPIQNQLQMRAPNQPVILPDQNTDRQLNAVFTFQGNQWNSSSNQVENVDISNHPSLPSCLQGRFPLQAQNGVSQRQAWPLEQQQLHQQMAACLKQIPRNPMDVGAVGRQVFRTPETRGAPGPVPQDAEPPPAQRCMFRNAPPAAPVNGVHHAKIASKPSCFYQAGSAPGVAAIPDEAVLSCQVAAGLTQNGVLTHQQQYLSFSDQAQINNHPVDRNVNACYSENK